MTQLWPRFVSWWLFKHTRGSPDVLHLTKYSSQVGSHFKVTTRCPQKKGNFLLDTLWSSFLSLQWSRLKKIQCLSGRKLPEVFKTQLKFLFRAIFEGVVAMSVLSLKNHLEPWGAYFVKWTHVCSTKIMFFKNAKKWDQYF